MGLVSLFVLVFVLVQPVTARTRQYYIGAVDILWDYAPSGLNLKTGVNLDKDEYVIIQVFS